MNKLITSPKPVQAPVVQPSRYVRLLVILVALLAGFILLRTWSTQPPAQHQVKTEIISTATLEERYGMRIKPDRGNRWGGPGRLSL